MDAVIFAAGLGTRLRPLTVTTPKPLVEVAGVAMLERVARRLVAAGADRLILNLHHLPDVIEEFVAARDGFGVEVLFSREANEVLETGGGLLRARRHLRGEAPFFLHNSDVVSDIPLEDMYRAHGEAALPLATLAVMERQASRHFVFDDDGLCGHVNHATGATYRAREPRGEVQMLGFSGVHVASAALPERLLEVLDPPAEGRRFSIADGYLRLARHGHRILPYRVDGALWLDIGTHESLAEADRILGEGTDLSQSRHPPRPRAPGRDAQSGRIAPGSSS